MTSLTRAAKPAPTTLAERLAAFLPDATAMLETVCVLGVAALMTGFLNLML